MDEIRVTDEAWLVSAGSTGDDSVYVEYRLGGEWSVRLTSRMYARVDGPVELVVRLSDDAGMNDDALAEGITTHVLRAIPMRDARQRLSWEMAEAYRKQGDADALPERFSGPGDFALLAQMFAAKAAHGDANPIRTLSTEHGVSRNTLAARIRKARSLGLLSPEGEPPELTTRGIELLEDSEGNQHG